MMLFDLQNDIGETNDISSQNGDLFETLKAELEQIKASWRHSREGGDYTW